MRELNCELKQLYRRNRDGSYATQADRERILQLLADQLHEAGFRHLHATGLKPKHIEALIQRWHDTAGLLPRRLGLASRAGPVVAEQKRSAVWIRTECRFLDRYFLLFATGARLGVLAGSVDSCYVDWTASHKFS